MKYNLLSKRFWRIWRNYKNQEQWIYLRYREMAHLNTILNETAGIARIGQFARELETYPAFK